MTLRLPPPKTDVLVAGSGAAGLLAALVTAKSGLTTTVVEAAPSLGGTTALGSGRVWIPANWSDANAGDTREAARRYLEQIFDTDYSEMIDALVETAAPMGEYVMRNSRHRFAVCDGYPDYHPSYEGATVGGRCFDMLPLALSELHPEARNTLRPNGYLPITYDEWNRWRYASNFDWELLHERQRTGVVTGGAALVAALADAVLENGGTILTGTALTGLRLDDAGDVIGATCETADGAEALVEARHVVLATGGFDADPSLRAAHLPRGLSLSASTPANRGTALRIAEQHGFPVDNLGQGWWMPMIELPGETMLGEPYPRALIRERGLPHQLIVNRAGRRFVDESAPYNEFGKAMHFVDADGATPNREAWMIYDADFGDRYGLPGIPKDGPLPAGAVAAATPRELAEAIGVDPEGLERTVSAFNGYCADGVDPEFGRGDNAYDRFYGDPGLLPGNNSLGPVARAPFTAVRVHSASIGSKGGPLTTTAGQVVGAQGRPVGGLYSVGNASAFWTKDGYPGPGATHTVGMVFAYRAGLDIVSMQHASPSESHRSTP